MTVRGLNHAVLFVADIERSTRFYCDVIGFEELPGSFPGGVFLRGKNSGNDHDLGLFQASGRRSPQGSVGLYHLAWEVETLKDLAAAQIRLEGCGALTGASNHASTKALYAVDPDGIDLELTWLVPDEFLESELLPGVAPTRPLDIDAEIQRYGALTSGGPRAERHRMTQLMHRLMS